MVARTHERCPRHGVAMTAGVAAAFPQNPLRMPADRMMTMPDPTTTDTRAMMLEWYQRNRARSRMIFDLISEDAYYSQPIALRHPIVFYEGHLPAFSFNTLVKKALGRPSIDASLVPLRARH